MIVQKSTCYYQLTYPVDPQMCDVASRQLKLQVLQISSCCIHTLPYGRPWLDIYHLNGRPVITVPVGWMTDMLNFRRI